VPYLYASEWSPDYGTPHRVADDASLPPRAELCEHATLQCLPCPPPRFLPLCFVDGVRQVEAVLYYSDGPGQPPVPGIAGVLAVGAVVPGPQNVLTFDRVVVRRLAIFAAGRRARLPQQPGGWSWDCHSVAEDSPEAPLQELQRRMRDEEMDLARALAEGGRVVCLDGPLHEVRGVDGLLVGYVKSHHQALLPPDQHARVGLLAPGQRTSVFQFSQRYSCYVRLGVRPEGTHPWYGIVRLEAPEALGAQAALRLLEETAAELPRYAGAAWTDPRAPQNLQPVAALERELRRRCGDPRLGQRAARAAARAYSQASGGPGPPDDLAEPFPA
jgi:hypothetical protein